MCDFQTFGEATCRRMPLQREAFNAARALIRNWIKIPRAVGFPVWEGWTAGLIFVLFLTVVEFVDLVGM